MSGTHTTASAVNNHSRSGTPPAGGSEELHIYVYKTAGGRPGG